MFKPLLCFAALLSMPALACAQAPVPPRAFSGTFVSLKGDTITLQEKDGKILEVQMTPGWTVSVNRPGAAADIKAGDFVATQNVPIGEGTGKATELRIMEPGYRPEEGTHPMSATNANMMTHGTVKSVTQSDDVVVIEIMYPGGSRQIVVAAGVPVTISDLLDKSVLKPGVAVSSVTRTGADGVPRASWLQLASKP